jgi:hypothetical protein
LQLDADQDGALLGRRVEHQAGLIAHDVGAVAPVAGERTL